MITDEDKYWPLQACNRHKSQNSGMLFGVRECSGAVL